MAAPRFLSELGQTLPITVPIQTAQAVETGDLVASASGNLIRAADFTWTSNLATTQTNFAALFFGASAQTKNNTADRPYGNSKANTCRVDTGGDWEYDCDSATFKVGDLVGPAKDTGNALLSQKVVAVASEALAIGRVIEAGTSITRVKIRLLSTLGSPARSA